MKRFTAFLFSFIIILSVIGCGQQTDVKEIPSAPQADLAYWRENIGSSQVDNDVSIGNSHHGLLIKNSEILQLIESVEYGMVRDYFPADAQQKISHGVSLTNREEDKAIYLCFYNDFTYVSLIEDASISDDTVFYYLANPDECKQFFIDNGMYLPLGTHTMIVDAVTDYFNNTQTQQISEIVQPGIQNREKSVIPAYGEIKSIDVPVTEPCRNYRDNAKYSAHAEVVYSYGNTDRGYLFMVYLSPADTGLEITEVFATELELLIHAVNPYIIGDVDYSTWMERLDAPYYNGFNYWLCAGSGGHCESSLEWCNSVMNCIAGLDLGNKTAIDVSAYPNQQIYTILLKEDSTVYDEPVLKFQFYDDCKYLIVCDCGTDYLLCKDHDTAYIVNNPQSVIDVFSMQGQYVSSRDYASMEQFVTDFLQNTPTDKINQINKEDISLSSDMVMKGKIANLKAESTDHLAVEDGKEKYKLDFIVTFGDGRDNKLRTFKANMFIYRNGDSWQINSFHMKNFYS